MLSYCLQANCCSLNLTDIFILSSGAVCYLVADGDDSREMSDDHDAKTSASCQLLQLKFDGNPEIGMRLVHHRVFGGNKLQFVEIAKDFPVPAGVAPVVTCAAVCENVSQSLDLLLLLHVLGEFGLGILTYKGNPFLKELKLRRENRNPVLTIEILC